MLTLHTEAQLRINEVCSANGSALTDFEGDTPDYIELLNTGSETVSTDDLFLTDNNNLFQWELPSLDLAPGEYLLVLCSGKELEFPEIHSNFGINSNGETIRLSDEDGTIIDFVVVPELHSDDVYARLEGGAFVHQDTPTPGEPNTTENFDGYAPLPVLNRQGGFYDQSFQLTISATEGNVQYERNNLYPHLDFPSEGILIDSTSSVTAQNFAPNKLPSRIVGATYLIREDHNLPVVTLIADSLELFDETDGIYMLGPDADPEWPHFGGNIWNNEHILSWMEVYQDRKQVIAQLAESRMHGGQSARNQPQRPFRFIAKDRLGTDRFYAQLQSQSSQSIYKKFVTRNGGSDYHRVHISDSFIERQVTEFGLDLEAKGSEPCVFYVNGRYWGFMDIQRVIDDWFIWSVTDYPQGTPIAIMEDDSLIIKGDISSFDSMLDFIESNDMSDDALFNEASELIDISNFKDYIITETFWNNIDWPANNVKSWRPLIDGGKWRYILFDMDVSLSSFGFATETTNGVSRFLTEFPDNKHFRLFDNLYQNEQFKHDFLNRYADLANSAFGREAVTSNLRKHVAMIWDEKGRHHDRWGSSRWFWETYWLFPRAYEFADKRSIIAVDQVKDALALDGVYELTLKTFPANAGYFHLNTLDSLDHDWKGRYFQGIPVDATALAKPGYVFSHWQSATGAISSTETISTEFDSEAFSSELVAVFTPVDATLLNVWPNPSLGEINIDFDSPSAVQAKMEIYKADGSLVYSEEFRTQSGVNQRRISDLNPGLHVICIDLPGRNICERILVH